MKWNYPEWICIKVNTHFRTSRIWIDRRNQAQKLNFKVIWIKLHGVVHKFRGSLDKFNFRWFANCSRIETVCSVNRWIYVRKYRNWISTWHVPSLLALSFSHRVYRSCRLFANTTHSTTILRIYDILVDFVHRAIYTKPEQENPASCV